MDSFSEYEDYVEGVKSGIKAAERQFSLENVIKLRGPAGLFKDSKNHKLCWKILEKCNENLEKCPIDLITFHRKGKCEVFIRVLRHWKT
jgi:L-iduronidase